ncbi:hypothetical protein [Streptomyces sp. IBSBF 3010]|uniref:hypothetical protein n=1 Tax=Streptomyces sp. IBSBF 3010 TaxID=2903526 RepID=UPI002FDBBFBA
MTVLINTHAMHTAQRYTEPSPEAAQEELDRRSNHAWEVAQAGDHAEAARLYADLAVARARVLGPDHPDTLNARSVAGN